MDTRIISKLTTAAGTTVTKRFEATPMKGLGHVAKIIKYPEGSRMAQLGIDKVVIRDAGKEGKHIMALSDKDGCCRMLGVTKPESKVEQSVIEQLKDYVNTMKKLGRWNLGL